ncbi:MAG: hypothetical protein WC307_07260 [Candidatus Nanoarchaeia archaeon]|jgi:predicted transcriptional regulator
MRTKGSFGYGLEIEKEIIKLISDVPKNTNTIMCDFIEKNHSINRSTFSRIIKSMLVKGVIRLIRIGNSNCYVRSYKNKEVKK